MQIDLAVNHVLQRQPGGFDDALDVIEGLTDLALDGVGQLCITVARTLARDVEKVSSHDPGTVGTNRFRTWWRNQPFWCRLHRGEPNEESTKEYGNGCCAHAETLSPVRWTAPAAGSSFAGSTSDER